MYKKVELSCNYHESQSGNLYPTVERTFTCNDRSIHDHL